MLAPQHYLRVVPAMRSRGGAALIVGGSLLASWLSVQPGAQRAGQFMGSADDPAINYSVDPLSNAVDDLNRKLRDGVATLAFTGRSGYLQSVIDALELPTDSQLLVFSQLSLQGRRINAANPRALFFNDRVAVGWVRDGELLEVAAHDRLKGLVFYTLEQRPSPQPQFKREFRCLGCHMNGDTLGVPGLLMFSVPPASDRAGTATPMDQSSPIAQRWGGWFVTGDSGNTAHLGNQVAALADRAGGTVPSLTGVFDPEGFRAATSDIAALLVF